MNRIKAFIYIYKKSLTSINYYKDVLEATISLSLKYFFTLALVSSVIVTISLAVPMYPKINSAMENFLTESKNIYPEGLVLSMNGSDWSINLPEPLVIPFPNMHLSDSEGLEQPEDVPTNLVVFDHKGTVTDFENQDTLILVNEKNVLVKEATKFTAYPIKDLPNEQIDKNKFVSIIDGLGKYTKLIPYFVTLFILLGITFYYFVFMLVYLALAAFVTWIASFLLGTKYTYSQNLRVCLHTVTLPMTIEVLSNIFGLNVSLPFWFASLNVVFTLVVLVTLAKKTGAAEPDKIQEPKKLDHIKQPSNMS